MLVYNIKDIEGFQEWLKKNTDRHKTEEEKQSAQEEQFEHYKMKAKEMGFKVDGEITFADAKSKTEEKFAGRVMAGILAMNEENLNVGIIPKQEILDRTIFFMKHCTNPNSHLYFDMGKYKPTAEKLIEKAHEVGALVSAAHPAAYAGNSEEELEVALKEYRDLGVDAIECYNCYNEIADYYTTLPIQFCKENNLFMSGGTDIHAMGDVDAKGNPSAPSGPRYDGVGLLNNNIVRQIPAEALGDWPKYWKYTREKDISIETDKGIDK